MTLDTNPFLTTWGGVDLVYGDPEGDIRIEDISWHLSNQSRYAGAAILPYHTSQHSVLVGLILAMYGCDAYTVKVGLAHDAHEYVLGDLPTPAQLFVKERNGGRDIIGEIKYELDCVIMPKLGISWPLQEHIAKMIKWADKMAFFIEAKQLFKFGEPVWLQDYVKRSNMWLYDIPITVLNSVDAQRLFMENWNSVEAAVADSSGRGYSVSIPDCFRKAEEVGEGAAGPQSILTAA